MPIGNMPRPKISTNKDPIAHPKPRLPEHLSKDKKLIISGSDTTYKEGIVPIDQTKDHADYGSDGFWNQHVIKVTGWPRLDKKTGNYYLNTQKGRLYVRILPAAIRASEAKSYIQDLFDRQIQAKGRIHCYWWGIQPEGLEEADGPHLWLDEPKEMERVGFQEALPPEPKQPLPRQDTTP